ncbi:MAG: glycosyltransferase family 4 protein [Actinobacteria bacterium]|nr:glycosyltransferase family 4 protein [Actinomycetota bacterium]
MAATVVVVAQFPPPVHGMSVAVAAVAELLDDEGCDVIAVDVAAPALERSVSYHLRRSVRVGRALATLVAARSRTRRCYLGCDTGLGMTYTLALLALARALGYRVWLHHHSTAYLSTRRSLFSAVVKVGGSKTTHLVACDGMGSQLRRTYGGGLRVTLLPLDFVVPRELAEARVSGANVADANPALVLGHLSNLTIDKGLAAVFDTLESVLALGVDARLELAGPVWTARDRVFLDERLRSLPQDRVTMLGPVYGAAKAEFFSRIDLFLFPSRYSHESFGIVTAEALASGVPVVAYRAGCLAPEHVGTAGVVLEAGQDFVAEATRYAAALVSPAERQRARRAAAEQSAHNRKVADESARALVASIVGWG